MDEQQNSAGSSSQRQHDDHQSMVSGIWIKRTFRTKEQTEELLKPHLESGDITWKDYQQGVLILSNKSFDYLPVSTSFIYSYFSLQYCINTARHWCSSWHYPLRMVPIPQNGMEPSRFIYLRLLLHRKRRRRYSSHRSPQAVNRSAGKSDWFS